MKIFIVLPFRITLNYLFVHATVLSMIIICVKILFCKHYFSPLNTFERKGKDSDPERITDWRIWTRKAQKHGIPNTGDDKED